MRICVFHLPTKLWPPILETPISCTLWPIPQHLMICTRSGADIFWGGNVCVFVVSGHKAWLCAMSLYSNSVRAVHDSVIPGRNFAVCTRLYVTSVSQFFAFDHKPSLKMSFTSYQNSPVPVNNEDFSLKEKSESLPRLNYVCLKCYCK